MAFSHGEFRTAGDWSPPERNCSFVCSDRRNWLSTVPAGSITGSFFISSPEGGRRGVAAFDVENGTSLQDLATSNTVQLVESDGKLFLVSAQQRGQSVDHCIDELEFLNPKAEILTCRSRQVSNVNVKKSGKRGLQVYTEHTWDGFGEAKLGIFNPLSKKLHKILLTSCFALLPTAACAEDQSIQDSLSGLWTSNAWESHDLAKKAAVALPVVLMMIIGARFAWGIFRRRRDPGNRFDIKRGLENSDIPRTGDPLWAIPADIDA